MAKISKQSMKGNYGKARRHQQRQRIISALTLTTIFFLTTYLLDITPSNFLRTNPRILALRRLGQTRTVRPAKPLIDPGILPMRAALSNPDIDPHKNHLAKNILSAKLNLISIEFEDDTMEDDYYEGIIGIFCELDFTEQKSNPPNQPMFRDVVAISNCDKARQVKVDLSEAVELIREFDTDVANQNLIDGPTVLELKGAVFHESRCGSTLAANTMVALNPVKNRVYSESSPPIAAIKACGEDYSECSLEASANLLKDVVYLMGRSNDPNEEFLYFKFQSLTTRMMGSFRAAFPDVPWMFLYREPVQVMMSHLDGYRDLSGALCVRSKHRSAQVASFIEREGYDFNELEDEEFCSIHLATICESALRNIADANGLGVAVKYSPDLVHDLLDVVFVKHFKSDVDINGTERVLKVSGTYSKNRGDQEEGAYQSDSESKEEKASDEVKQASKLFLQPSFEALGNSPFNINNFYK